MSPKARRELSDSRQFIIHPLSKPPDTTIPGPDISVVSTSDAHGVMNLARFRCKRAKDLGLGEDDLAKYVGRLSREVEASGTMDKIAVGK